MSADTADCGLPLLDARGLSELRRPGRLGACSPPPADTAELPGRARAVLREAGWFATLRGHRGPVRPQAGAAGRDGGRRGGGRLLLSGTYLVWSVRHTITTQSHTMAFVLVRNAVGPAPAAGEPAAARDDRLAGRRRRGSRLPEVGRSMTTLLFELADRLHNRFYGKYRGIVTAVDQATLRIKATVPAVLGTTPTGWCLPCVPYAGPGVGFFFIPDAGAAVWIEFEGGDVSYPIWSGCFWRAGELPADAAPTTRGLVTAAPHKLLFDDAADEVTLDDASNGTVVAGQHRSHVGPGRQEGRGRGRLRRHQRRRAGGDVMGDFLTVGVDIDVPARRHGRRDPGRRPGVLRR